MIYKMDFEKKVTEFHSYYHDHHAFLISAGEVFRTLICALVVDQVPVDSVTTRVKERDECVDKFKRKYLDDIERAGEDYQIQNHITDLVGVRIVCLYTDDVKKIQTLIEDNFTEIDITDKTSQLESTEDKFGYKSLHLDLKLKEDRLTLPEYSKFKDVVFELQIRTIIQDAWSVLDHKIKYKKNIPLDLKRRINRLSALFEVADEEFLRIKGETQKEQEKAKTEISENSKQLQDNLDVFKFLSVAEKHFPFYRFIEYKADGFVGDILSIDPTFSTETLIKALEENKDRVEKYIEEKANYMNPYTIIRHAIYMLNQERFNGLLFEVQRRAIEEWLN